MGRKVLVSYCLLGQNCRFNGSNCLNSKLLNFLRNSKIEAIGVCPEELGGLRGMRGPFEFKGSVSKIHQGKSQVVDSRGKVYTKDFLYGACRTLEIAKKNRIKWAILKSRSPSCSPDYIYDGTFKGVLKKGLGIAAYILKKNKIKLLSEKNYSTRLKI